MPKQQSVYAYSATHSKQQKGQYVLLIESVDCPSYVVYFSFGTCFLAFLRNASGRTTNNKQQQQRVASDKKREGNSK